jgi:hypothetical protein
MEPTDEEKMFAAVAHVSGCALGPVVPAIIWFIKKDQSPFVAYHAIQAGIYQLIAWVAFSLFGTITCGFGFMAFPLIWLPSLWWGWQAYQGSKDGYPGIAQFGRTEQLTG